jgi:hypothetical protein
MEQVDINPPEAQVLVKRVARKRTRGAVNFIVITVVVL